MYKTYFEDVKKMYQPLVELSTISKKTAESMFKEYSEFGRELMTSSMAQTKQLAGCKDFFAVMDSQSVFVKNLDSKLVDNAQKQVQIMMEARDESGKVFDEMSDAYSSSMKTWMAQVKG